ncbi:MAG: hypothetical protein ACFFG0_33680, partial [Candidatus Thorarchaeota archaeon]
MLSEKIFEDIICKYPELIEESLVLKGRQLALYGRRMDILFEDRFKRKLIIELKVGPIKDEHIGQILSYEGILLSADDPTIRVMLLGNRVPPNIQRSLDHHGIACKEITASQLKKFLSIKRDNEFLSFFQEEIYIPKGIKNATKDSGKKMNREKRSSGIWIFQANPKLYRLLEKLKSGDLFSQEMLQRFFDETPVGSFNIAEFQLELWSPLFSIRN